MKGANLILRYDTTWKGSASGSAPVRLEALAPSLAPLRHKNAHSSFSTGFYVYRVCGIFLDLRDEDDRDHDDPDLVRSVCPNGRNGASIPIVASCRFWSPAFVHVILEQSILLQGLPIGILIAKQMPRPRCMQYPSSPLYNSTND